MIKPASRRTSRRITAVVAAIAMTAGGLLAAAPAHAAGSFSVKLAAPGCTEADYKGSSYSQTINGGYWAYAKTSYRYPICIPFTASSIPGARAIAGSTMGPWGYSPTSEVVMRIQKANSTQKAYGNHSVGNGYYRNT